MFEIFFTVLYVSISLLSACYVAFRLTRPGKRIVGDSKKRQVFVALINFFYVLVIWPIIYFRLLKDDL